MRKGFPGKRHSMDVCKYKAHLENSRYHNVDIRLSGKSSDLMGLKRYTEDNVWQIWCAAKEFGLYPGVNHAK